MVAAAVPTVVSFGVRSTPITQGSMRAFHRWAPDGSCIVSLVSMQDARLKEWRRLVATAAARAMRDMLPFAGPVEVRLTFYFKRPATHKGETWAAVKGRNDLDKLQRAVYDALTDAAVVGDDAFIVRVKAEKRWCATDERAGVDVLVEAL